MNVTEKLLDYVRFDTTSDPLSETIPSTPNQKVLGAYLKEKLLAIGINDARMDEYGYVYGSIPANASAPSIGLIAHMDTSDAVSGANIKPHIIEHYDGSDIVLSDSVSTTVKRFPNLTEYIGKTLIVTDGETLLGADDKAGIAIIMEVAEFLFTHLETKHGKVYIAFTPDEEIGRGTIKFDYDWFKADFAYTLDGAKPNEVEYENFNAAAACVTVHGISTHPGSAKNKMINALHVAMEYQALLPAAMRPEHTEGYEGFIHLMEVQGDVEKTVMQYILRDHDFALLTRQKELMFAAKDYLNQKYPSGTVEVEIKDSYRNMKEKFNGHMESIELVQNAMQELGMSYKSTAIRGGTDGAALTWHGLLCPNLGTGGQNYHGRNEFACVEEMEEGVKLVLKVLEKAVQ